jgi:hypothetical protein
MTKLLILSSHSILEYDDLRLFTDLGYDAFIIGGYQDPRNPGEKLRPALPDAPYHPELIDLAEEQRRKHAGQRTDLGIIDWAKADLHPDLVEWADIIMVNCFPDTWIGGQWEAIRHKRVIWRTIGQSSPWTETEMRPLAEQGLQVVRYSPAERRAFEPIDCFAGEDALIRFAKYPSDFPAWIGDNPVVGNVTQNMDLRGDHCGYGFWQEATKGLPTQPAGLGSERIGGLGTLSYPAMLDYLSHLRAYLYTGTQPASYTLGFMEAMLAGVPVIAMGPKDIWMPTLYEAHELTQYWSNDPAHAAAQLRVVLEHPDEAADLSRWMRAGAVSLFSADVIGPQ